MEANVIIAASAKSNKSHNNVWVVFISGKEQDKMYCKNAYKAMRFAFLLKKRTGLNISDNCLTRLSHEIALAKKENQEAAKAKVAEVAEALTTNKKAAPKARKPRKRTAKVVSMK